ncbi:hypothetical protein [Floridanema evergladense]|uniref:Uncharacterized protein n=1 Tax=Floridaenema evergladense BLCC-F167 TaxID=3153639 RepID=A0ABV4WGM7_9CYAN
MKDNLSKMLIKNWKISENAADILTPRPELVERLAEAKSLPPISIIPGIPPQTVEYLMDDLPYICMEGGKLKYYRDWSEGFDPLFWEIDINGEVAVFVINGEYIVNRLVDAAENIMAILSPDLEVKKD